MKPRQKVSYLISHNAEPDSRLIDYLVNQLHHIVINDFYINLNYNETRDDKKLIGKVINKTSEHMLEAKKRLISSVDNVILDYEDEASYIRDSEYGISLLKYARGYGKNIILSKDL